MTTKTKTTKNVIQDIANEIATERQAQVARWGQQDHPSTYSPVDRERAAKNADRWKEINDARVEADRLTWDGILLEEVWEALAEEDLTNRRMELIQVAAVAAAEVEAIDRRVATEAAAAAIAFAEADSASETRTCPATEKDCVAGCGDECLLEDEVK